jgi:hypothetical protein
MPDGFLVLIESVIGRRFVAVDGKWPAAFTRRRRLRNSKHARFLVEGQKTSCLKTYAAWGFITRHSTVCLDLNAASQCARSSRGASAGAANTVVCSGWLGANRREQAALIID